MAYELVKILLNRKLCWLIMIWYRVTQVGIVFADVKTGKIRYANNSFLNRTGRTLKEYKKEPFINFVHPPIDTKQQLK
jgi:hypothetical protein